MAFRLTEEQYAAVHDREGALLVSAAAGSGKTRVLVERLLDRVEEGADIDRFLVITFTKAAAAELRSRIVEELSRRMADAPGDAFLRRQATLVYKAQISTIDAFCTQFLREEGHRLDLDHDFRLCDEAESQILQNEALAAVLDGRYEHVAENPDFAFLVDTMSAGRDDSRLEQIALDIRGRIQSYPDPGRWLDAQEETFALTGVTDAGATPWGALLLSDAARLADYWARRLGEAAELCTGDDKLVKAYVPALETAQATLRSLEAACSRGWDAARAALEEVAFPRFGTVRGAEDPQAQERVKALWDRCKKRVKKLEDLLADDSAGLLEDMRAVYPAIRALFALVRDFEGEYAKEKARRGVLDFSDLEHMTARLLWEGEEPSSVAKRWAERFDEVMVDEYQDTNAVQNAIFDALTLGGQNLFMVGDVKQSIYRFRLADPTIFLEKYRAFPPREEAAEGEPRRVLLSRNFRSRPQVLEGVNDTFRALMSRDFGEMDYTDDEALIPGAAFPDSPQGDYRVELDLLDASPRGAEPEGAGPERAELEARFVARRVEELLREGFPVSDGAGGTRPAQPGDIVLLMRSPGPVLHWYAGALGELDIPWEAEGGEDFFAQTEIQVALSLLQIVDNPRQDVALIAVLRSAVYGFSADRLSQIRAGAPQADFYTALTQDGGEDVKAFLAELAGLRERAGEEGCEALLWRLFDRTNLLGVYGALDEGEKRRGNLLTLSQLARDFEKAGHKGLFGFLTYLRRLEESGGRLQAAAHAGGRGVRILSIHKSKGLEFPIVILADLAHQFNREDQKAPMLFQPRLGVGPKRLDLARMVEYPTLARLAIARQMDADMGAEELRLLYVAMTRAQEKLILSVALTRGTREVEMLLSEAGLPVEPQALMGRQSPGQWLLLAALARPEAAFLWNGALPPYRDVTLDLGPAWDIRWEDCAGCLEPSRRTPQAVSADGAGEGITAAELLERFRWTYPHPGDVEAPSKLTATQLKGRELDMEAAQDSPQPPREMEFPRPRFAAEQLGLTPTEKGTALHLVMQYIDFRKCTGPEAIQGEIHRLVAEKFITPQQGEAVDAEKIYGFFASPLGQEVLASPTLRREFKFSILAPAAEYFPQAGAGEQVLLQGVVDCFFRDERGITVIDFKTDRVYGDKLPERAGEYAPQLGAYARALEQITGAPVARKILWFFSEGRAVEL